MLRVIFTNLGSVPASFAVEFEGGETGRSLEQPPGGTTDIPLDEAGPLPPGTTCWADIEPVDGPNRESSDTFTYEPGPGPAPHFTLMEDRRIVLSWDPAETSEATAAAAGTGGVEGMSNG
jgi:hypothetical protein